MVEIYLIDIRGGYSGNLVISALFPKVNEEYQNIAEEDIKIVIEKIKAKLGD